MCAARRPRPGEPFEVPALPFRHRCVLLAATLPPAEAGPTLAEVYGRMMHELQLDRGEAGLPVNRGA